MLTLAVSKSHWVISRDTSWPSQPTAAHTSLAQITKLRRAPDPYIPGTYHIMGPGRSKRRVCLDQSESFSKLSAIHEPIHDSYKLLYFESEQEYRFFSKISKKLKTVLVRGWTEYHKSVRQVSTKSPVNILQEYDPLAKNSAVWQTMGGKSQKLAFYNRILTIISKLGWQKISAADVVPGINYAF